MRGLLALVLLAVANAQYSGGTPFNATLCMAGEFYYDGYSTGQTIEMDYVGTEITLDQAGDTQLTVAFFVPKMYSQRYENAAFAITFNRNRTFQNNDFHKGPPVSDDWKDRLGYTSDTGSAVATVTNMTDTACLTNHFNFYTNRTECGVHWDDGQTITHWTMLDNVDNECLTDVAVTVPWTSVLDKRAFGAYTVIDNGIYTEVFLTSTVETWNRFHETVDEDPDVKGSNYFGQMTGDQQHAKVTGQTPTDGKSWYAGDGGDIDVHFPALSIEDERYTLYQIPFILRFPKTVTVQTSFTAGSKIHVMTGLVKQDAVKIDFNPRDTNAALFGALDVTVETEVQYPYGIVPPNSTHFNMGGPTMKAYVGALDAADAHALQIRFMSWDDPGKCGGLVNGDMCYQQFKMRILPSAATPCSVAGKYTIEYWAKCVNQIIPGAGTAQATACTMDDETLAGLRTGNGYFTMTFDVVHQDFCPTVMDTIRVVADFSAYHDQYFTHPVSPLTIQDQAYTNDIIYYEVSYRTASEMSGQMPSQVGSANSDFRSNQFLTNNNAATSTDEIIDYVRATKIFMTVTIGEKNRGGVAVPGWNSTNAVGQEADAWTSNLHWSLGGTQIAGEDFSGTDLVVLNAANCAGHAHCVVSYDRAKYEILLCKDDPVNPDYIYGGIKGDNTAKNTDCFDFEEPIATWYLDFDQVHEMQNATHSHPPIDENEVAFKLRLDERIIPIDPETDDSFISLTVEAEVYYKGNLHATRRRLQQGQPTTGNQKLVKSYTHSVNYRKAALKACPVDDQLDSGLAILSLDYGTSGKAPTLAEAPAYALKLGQQLNAHYNLAHALRVVEIEHCTTSCELLYQDKYNPSQRRRLQTKRAGAKMNELHVTVQVDSVVTSTAGQIINTFQVDLESGAAFNVQAFKDGTLTDMNYPDCVTSKYTGKATWNSHTSNLASAASPLACLVALLASVATLLL